MLNLEKANVTRKEAYQNKEKGEEWIDALIEKSVKESASFGLESCLISLRADEYRSSVVRNARKRLKKLGYSTRSHRHNCSFLVEWGRPNIFMRIWFFITGQ